LNKISENRLSRVSENDHDQPWITGNGVQHEALFSQL